MTSAGTPRPGGSCGCLCCQTAEHCILTARPCRPSKAQMWLALLLDCRALHSGGTPAQAQLCLSLPSNCGALHPGGTPVPAQPGSDAVMQMGAMGHPGGEGDMHAGMMAYDGAYAAARRPPHEKRKATNQAGLPDDGYR